LVKEGYIKNFKPLKDKDNKSNFKVDLKYNLGNPVISMIVRISRPGRRIYSRAESIAKINNGLGISIVSTSKGVMTDSEARKQNIGGEIICKVF
jgi:small subunit ribosomal protein S8